MKYLLTILLLITAINFSFAWNGVENMPDTVRAFDGDNEVEVISEWTKVDNVYHWNVYDEQGNLITFLNFWTN